MSLKLYFIRHGRTLGNTQGRYVGCTDEPLLAESMLALKREKMPMPQLVALSPMLRCRQTAECLFPGVRGRIFEGLREMDFGDFEYKNCQELNGNKDYQAYIDSGGVLDFPGAEPAVRFKERCLKAFREAVAWAEDQGAENLALVVHGGTIMAVLEAYGVPKKNYFYWQIKNGERIEGELDDQGNIFIREWGTEGHL